MVSAIDAGCGGLNKREEVGDLAVITMKSLLEAGVHFGHQTRRWNPKMAPYIFTERNGIYIIDLQKTVKKVEEAYNFIRDVVAEGNRCCLSGRRSRRRKLSRKKLNAAACLCQPAVVGWNADKLQDHQQEHRPAAGTGENEGRRLVRCITQERSAETGKELVKLNRFLGEFGRCADCPVRSLSWIRAKNGLQWPKPANWVFQLWR